MTRLRITVGRLSRMGFTSSIDVDRMHTWIRAQTFDSRAALVVRSRGTHREDVQGARHLSYERKLCASGLRECRNELLIRALARGRR